MFRTLSRLFLPNRLDWICRKAQRRGVKRVLLAWNRGLGDIPLGLYAIVERIRSYIPQAEITFLIRPNLQEGFSLWPDVKTIVAPHWERGQNYNVSETLASLGLSIDTFDLVIPWPKPSDWVRWQYGKITPRLEWDPAYDALYEKFELDPAYTYIGVQFVAETQYGFWRNWPHQRWEELFTKLRSHPQVRVLAFGFGKEPSFEGENYIDLRGKTSLFELLSLIRNRCHTLILPDSGILSMAYYLNVDFPIHVVSLWADPNHGILKQNVASPNPSLSHTPLIGQLRDLSSITATDVYNNLCIHN